VSNARLGDVVVVDTNVVSYLFKRDTRGELYKSHVEGKLAMIAAQTFAELELMPLNNNWGSQRYAALHGYLKKFVFVQANQQISLLWAKVQAHAKRAGRPVSLGDSWIAATALAYDAPLVTHNPKDFKNVPGLTIISEK
jgi:tRNA(fMet)-specific endonuclease VapC